MREEKGRNGFIFKIRNMKYLRENEKELPGTCFFISISKFLM